MMTRLDAATRPAGAQALLLARSSTNLSDLAYDRSEELIMTCALLPGRFLSIQDLQVQTGIGRTPMHQAVSRLASDTLIRVRPRHGIQVAPINLRREFAYAHGRCRPRCPLRRPAFSFRRQGANCRAEASNLAVWLDIRAPLQTKRRDNGTHWFDGGNL